MSNTSLVATCFERRVRLKLLLCQLPQYTATSLKGKGSALQLDRLPGRRTSHVGYVSLTPPNCPILLETEHTTGFTQVGYP
jgi:hypothetical protein